jgi:arylamine N-acetyltransferase
MLPARTEEGLFYLSALQKYQLSHVPFENLLLHYSKEHFVSLDNDDLFEKVVASRNGRGGYCMENSTFFRTVLKLLDSKSFPRVQESCFRVGLVGGKKPLLQIHHPRSLFKIIRYLFPVLTPSNNRSHSVNLVCIARKTYLVGVGFGGKLCTDMVSLPCSFLIREWPHDVNASRAWTDLKMGSYRCRNETNLPEGYKSCNTRALGFRAPNFKSS